MKWILAILVAIAAGVAERLTVMKWLTGVSCPIIQILSYFVSGIIVLSLYWGMLTLTRQKSLFEDKGDSHLLGFILIMGPAIVAVGSLVFFKK